ncbi:YbaY family lipoprotein [Bartonella apihabitans]|nr:YbaY family lipoprotein [Bartonella apihabitans]WLT09242.1 YbaY family lipoprotein [Bartonella apihabitans]
MKRNIFAALTFGATALVGVSLLTIPSFIMNTIVPAYSSSLSSIHGDVTYLQRIALPQHAYLVVQLVDVTNEEVTFPCCGRNFATTRRFGSYRIRFATERGQYRSTA